MNARVTEGRTEELVRLLSARQRLLVLTHTNPDPDAMGSAMGLRHLAERQLGMPSSFGLVGRVMRAENRAMVRCLGIDLTPVDELDLDAFDCLALVDTQPGFGHTSLPSGRPIDLVLDHHVPPEPAPDVRVAYQDVRPQVGATSSLVTSYLMELGISPTADVATGLFYGIRTDTADLSRNTSPIDLDCYEFLIDKVDRQKLAEITTPPLPLPYFQALRDALTNIRIFDQVVLCSLGKLSSPEMVAEVADLLVRLEGRQTVYCGGLVDGTYYVSVRDEQRVRDAWYLIRDALGGEGSFGGHGSVAGGSIVLSDASPRAVKRLERRLERNILKSMGVEGATVSGLVES
ncbi:MAG: DHH family phosphoesterase [Planctomycetota bacterium]